MRIGIAQLHTRPGDLAGSLARIEAQARVASSRGADLLVFPAPTITGPTPLPFAAQDVFLPAALQGLGELAGRVACACLVPLMVELDDRLVCEVVLLQDGTASLARLAPLAELPFEGDEGPSLEGPLVIEVAGTRVGLAFVPEEIDELVRDDRPVDVVVYLVRCGFAADDPSSTLGVLSPSGRPLPCERAFGLWVVGASAVGGYGPQVFSGSSFVAAPDGTLVAQAPAFEEALIVAEVSEALVGEGIRAEPYDSRYHLWQALAVGLRDYADAAGTREVVLGLDGGVSSSTLAVLASDALGPTHVHVLLAADGPRASEAAELARNLRVEARTAAARPAGLSWALPRDLAQLELGAWARSIGGLCLSSADKTGIALEPAESFAYERAFAPLADVWRSDVLDVARLRNTISPVFPSLAVAEADLPACVREAREPSGEMLLAQVDGMLAAHIVGAPQGLWGSSPAMAQLRAMVLSVWHEAGISRSVPLPCLVMSSVTLLEAALSPGFVWDRDMVEAGGHLGSALADLRGMLGRTVPGALVREGDREEGPRAPDQSLGSTLSETFDLLRDLSASGDASDWHHPFSEN